MLTKGRIQFIKGLADKKQRIAKGLFVVEGAKSVAELLMTELIIEELYVTHEFAKKYEVQLHAAGKRQAAVQKWLKPQLVEAGELKQMSSLEATDGALALVKQPAKIDVDIVAEAKKDIVLILEDVRDPGNLGTIIRIADWYGIKHIFASVGTVDMFNNKTIIASMGSFARVHIQYGDVRELLTKCNEHKILTIGSVLDSKSSHAYAWPKTGVLVIGNEANGITENTRELLKNTVTIPSYGSAESLNAGVATAVLLDEWRRSL
jgi:RNA methyltransferase, TrmH family